MSPDDLQQIRVRALTLRNICGSGEFGDGEDPYVWTCKDGTVIVYVADDQDLVHVPPYDGQARQDVGDAVALAGSDILSLLAEIERLRGAS